jgi:glycogen phosphorylase
MARLTPEYSANRTVREYTQNHYLPAAAAFTARADQKGKLGVAVSAWQRKLADQWRAVSFGPLKVGVDHTKLHFEATVYLGGLDPDAVRVELFADGREGGEAFRAPMERGTRLPDGGFLYGVSTGNGRNANDYTVRVVAYHPSASVPLEANQILWQK